MVMQFKAIASPSLGIVLISAVVLSACSTAPLTPAQTVAAPPTAAATTTTAAGAAASVVVGKGVAVNRPECTHASCAYVTATTSGFAASVTCTVAGPDGDFGVTWEQAANETKQSPNFYGYPGTTVIVRCSAAGQTASGTLTW